MAALPRYHAAVPWRITLDGEREVLCELAQELFDGHLAVVRKGKDFLLVVAEIDEIDNGRDAMNRATTLVAQLQGIARLLVTDLDVDTTIAVADIEALDEPVDTGPALIRESGVAKVKGSPRVMHSTSWSRWMKRAGANAGIADLFVRIGKRVWWDDIGIVLDTIGNDLGGEHRIVDLGWARRRDMERLRPTDDRLPMQRADEVILLRIVRNWLLARSQ